MPSLRNTLPRFDGEIGENNRVSSSSAFGISSDRPDLAPEACLESASPFTEVAVGEKAKARDLLAAIRTLKAIEREQRAPTGDERESLERFPGFGPLALRIFPDPMSGTYKDPAWQSLGEELLALMNPEEYASARRSTFNAFYTPPLVIRAMYAALSRLGVPPDATILEPGCGPGRFLGLAPEGMRFIGVELDSLSGRVARSTPGRTSASRTSAIPASPKSASTRRSATSPSPTSRSSTWAGGCRCTISSSPGRSTRSDRAGSLP